jgi:hypothetical protein
MNISPWLVRLTSREYVPMFGAIALWALVVMAVGMAEGMRLLAAFTMMRAVQLFTRMATLAALRRRNQAPDKIVRKSVRRVFRIQLASVAAGLLVMALLNGFLLAAGQRHLAALTALIAVGYPARHVLQMQRHSNVQLFLSSVNWVGAALVAPAVLLDWRAAEIAVMIGSREWIAALLSIIWSRRGEPSQKVSLEPITSAEIAGDTAIRARRAFAYLVGKALLGLVVPGAALIARTGRSFGIHHRLERFVPRHRPSFILFALGPAAVAGAIILWVPEPALLLIAALLMRVAAAAGSILIWSPYLDDGRADQPNGDEE